MPRPLTFVFPMPPNIGNGSHGHWRARHRQRTAYLNLLDSLQAAGKLPAPPRRALERALISSVMHLGQLMDMDNAMRRHKWIGDWLKTRGYIVDDSPRFVTWTGFPEQVVKRGADYRIELTLTPKAA